MSEKRHNELLEKKYMLEENLMNLERQIYDLETRYLEETTNTGKLNIYNIPKLFYKLYIKL